MLEHGWEIVGPDGYLRSGVGDTKITELAAGKYELQWTSYSGWISPSPNPLVLLLAVPSA